MPRKQFDAYPTPQPVAQAVARAAFELYPDKDEILEPSAGMGVFVREARLLWPQAHITAVEIDERHRDALSVSGANDLYISAIESFLEGSIFPRLPYNNQGLVIGNPPFGRAEVHIGMMLDYLYPGTPICMLLKMNFLCSRGRAEGFWRRKQLRYIKPFDTRPSFVKGVSASNDTNEYALFVWEVGYRGEASILFPHITWQDPTRRRRQPSSVAP